MPEDNGDAPVKGPLPNDKILNVYVNPLALLSVDEPWASALRREPSVEDVLGYLCTPGVSSDLNSLVARYREISVEPQRVFAAPAEQRILARLVWPLRNAKGCYMVGNYIGTVSLCGMVAEMLAILIFEVYSPAIHAPRAEEKPMDEAAQKGLFGSSFERLGQERRTSVLHTLGLIDEEMRGWFNTVRLKRRTYLHYYSVGEGRAALDAVEAFKVTVSLVVKGLGLNVKDGRLILSPALLSYLEKTGIARPAEPTTPRNKASE